MNYKSRQAPLTFLITLEAALPTICCVRGLIEPQCTGHDLLRAIPELPAAMTNHMRGISDVITRSRREQQHEQEYPAARRGGRCVSASELVGFGTGVERKPGEPLRVG
jgi:hypothetical protein